ncbi:ATP-binding protein [Bacillus haynesii]|uniref:ATP-binding protein n=1 Tax=Bacillus haynesii TaxID=1925021 RepID=UPI00227FF459|nr:ATP-binding protein [Bacillus haynesii]MCY7753290.1 ATP-binding protein [Bacillus haynesii]
MSTETIHTTGIEFDPRVLYESLGSKIIESDSIAIAEQIKNAVDAKADNIVIDFSKYYEDIIVIENDGIGMSIEEIQQNWFLVGTTNKTDEFNKLGGKGIGRFSLFRLANIIKIETCHRNKKYSFTLNKRELKNEAFLSKFKIKLSETPSSQEDKFATRITLTNLKKDLNFLEISKELENLNPPYGEKKFKICYPNSINIPNYLKPEEATPYAPFFAYAKFKGNKIISYDFKCSINNKEYYRNSKFDRINKELKKTPLPDIDLGEIEICIYNFFFDKRFIKSFSIDDSFIKSNFLNAYQGISVYRNHFKIYGHGEEDWLKLAEKRVQAVGKNIDNKLTFGYIILDKELSLSLEEKTNREGFIRNDSSKYFSMFVEIIVKQFGLDREKSAKILKKTVTELYDSISNNSNNASETQGTAETSGASETSGTLETSGASETSRYKFANKLGGLHPDIEKRIKSPKVKELLNEISNINITKYTYATAFLLRSFIEVTMDEYIIMNYDQIKTENAFKNYIIDQNKNVKISFPGNPQNKDIAIRKKIMHFKSLLKGTDIRSLKHLDDLGEFIDDINLAIHWTDKRVSISDLLSHWSNSKFFIEFLCLSV